MDPKENEASRVYRDCKDQLGQRERRVFKDKREILGHLGQLVLKANEVTVVLKAYQGQKDALAHEDKPVRWDHKEHK